VAAAEEETGIEILKEGRENKRALRQAQQK